MSKYQQSNLSAQVKQAGHITPRNKRNMLYPVTTLIMLSTILIILGLGWV